MPVIHFLLLRIKHSDFIHICIMLYNIGHTHNKWLHSHMQWQVHKSHNMHETMWQYSQVRTWFDSLSTAYNCSSSCENGGTCESGQFACTCPMGYTGKTCGELVDNCVGQACENGGTCINALNSFTCACTAGYSGDTCSTDLDLCSASPCQNGGTCIDYGDGYYCECPTSVYLDSPLPDCAGWCTVLRITQDPWTYLQHHAMSNLLAFIDFIPHHYRFPVLVPSMWKWHLHC